MAAKVTMLRGSKTRETETKIMTGDGLALSLNLDGSMVFSIYSGEGRSARTLRIEISAEDVASQAHVLRRWRG